MLRFDKNNMLISDRLDNCPGVSCTFFGTKVLYRAQHPLTLQRVSYIFDRFLCPKNSEPDLEFALLAEGQSSFVQAIVTPSLNAMIYYRYRKEESWRRWSYQDTPFPPLQIQPLKGRFLVLHGCAMVTPAGGAVVFIAPSMAGKTTLLIELCRRGYSALSDDLLFIEPATGRVAHYPKPVGVREGTLPLFLGLADSDVLQQALCFEAYGTSPKTWLVHLDELIPHCYHSQPWVKIKSCVLINRGGTGQIEVIEPPQAILRILPQVISSGLNASQTLRFVIELMQGISLHDLDVTDLNRACDQVERLVETLPRRKADAHALYCTAL